jgi:hypothetical protein
LEADQALQVLLAVVPQIMELVAVVELITPMAVMVSMVILKYIGNRIG